MITINHCYQLVITCIIIVLTISISENYNGYIITVIAVYNRNKSDKSNSNNVAGIANHSKKSN